MEHPSTAPHPLTCAECGRTFEVDNPRWRTKKRFCSDTHAQDFANRQTVRGKAMAAAVLAWRAKRGSGEIGKAALAELCSIADQFNEEDRKAGRPPVADYFAALNGDGYRYVDRRSFKPARVANKDVDRADKKAKPLPVA
jgi:hypothetical protein